MKRIHKYQAVKEAPYLVKFPGNTTLLKVNIQYGLLTVWVEEELQESFLPKYAKVYATGAEVPKSMTYIDTLFDGPYVWHVYLT